MYTNFSNLRFNIIQAINPYIQNSSNKCFGKSIISLPNNKVKSTINLPKKLLNKNFKLTSQPSVDLVTLSPDAKIANVSKPTQDSKVAYGKLIKKVLNRYFDNDNIATDLMEDKKTNLNQLVEELGKEQYCKYKAPRKYLFSGHLVGRCFVILRHKVPKNLLVILRGLRYFALLSMTRLVILRHKVPKQSSFYRFDKVGNCLIS
ncbi:MAG: hypothetical protein UDK34_07185 [Cyanobacteriota bacterium]|nr:hypothetical protein [Cyanobacteriota bacterium]